MDNNKFVITDKGVLKEYHGDEEVLQIPEGVKVIGTELLGYNRGEKVRKLILPEGVVELKERAFCTSKISEVILPGTLRKIGKDAFGSCENLRRITIPDGVEKIPDCAFFMSGLEEITLPDSVMEIGKSAFQHCLMLKKINFSNLEKVKIGAQAFTGCHSLVNENGLFVLQNRLFNYHSVNKNAYVVIPDDVTQIELDAFAHSGQIHLEMSVNCPSWAWTGKAKRYGFARSLLDFSGSSITFRDAEGNKVASIVLANKEETEPKEYGAILSIKAENGKFDFAGYDSYFASLAKIPNKIQVALARVEYPYELSKEMAEVYQSFLKKQAVAVGKMLIDDDRMETLEMLGKKQLLPVSAVKKLIDYSSEKDKLIITAWLLEYNNNASGKADGKEQPLKQEKKPSVNKKADTAWKKPKAGTNLISRYLGQETEVVFPADVDGIAITGIANISGTAPEDFKNLISKEKKKKCKAADNSGKIVETVNVDAIDFATSVFALCEFGYEEEWEVRDAIEQRGGTIKESVSEEINYLVVPDRDIVKNSKVKKVIEFQKKGKPISILKFSECRKHMLQWDVDTFGENGAKIAAEYKIQLADGKVTLQKYIGQDSHIVIPEFVGEYPVVALGKGCFQEGFGSAHKSQIHSVVIPGCIKELPENLFDYCQNLTGIVISEGVLTVGECVFSDCKNLEEIVLPESLTTIEKSAFLRCEKLKKIVIPKGVTSVKSPFSGCDNLEEIVVSGENAVYDSGENCNAIMETATNTLVAGCRNSKIPETVTVIGDSAFSGLDTLYEFEVPEGIVEIGNNVFNGCFNLQSIKLPQSLVKIGYYAFESCRELKKMELPLNVEKIHVSVFGRCENLKELVVNDKLTEIEELEQAWMYNWGIKTFYGSAKSIAKSIAQARRGEYIEI